jgi:hypothetical protein
VDSLEKVIEKLATTEKTTIAIAREVGGKVRVTSGSWEGEKVFAKGEVLEVPQLRRRPPRPHGRAADIIHAAFTLQRTGTARHR